MSNGKNCVKNVMVVGVGGQGTLLASRILGNLYLSQGFDVKMSEVHGMAQRGGSVVTYVRYGEKVHSPLIGEGEADIIISFEELEAARWMSYLKPNGAMIVNTQQIDPMPVIIGAASYPEDIVGKMAPAVSNLVTVDALALAKQAGNVKSVNVVLLGVMAKSGDIGKDAWLAALEQTVPVKFLELNKTAFELGYGA